MNNVSDYPGSGWARWSVIENLIGHKIDMWDVFFAFSFIVPILSVLSPDVDDGFALFGALLIYLANGAVHSNPKSDNILNTGTVSFRTYDTVGSEVGNEFLKHYLSQLRTSLVFEGYTSDQVETAISLNSTEVASAVGQVSNIAVKETVLNIVQNNLSPTGSYFTSPYTGKRYAFVFGSVDDLLVEFMHDDYQYILKESLPVIMNALNLRRGG